jgi:hypothetical protein
LCKHCDKKPSAVSISIVTALGFQSVGQIDNPPQSYPELPVYNRLR